MRHRKALALSGVSSRPAVLGNSSGTPTGRAIIQLQQLRKALPALHRRDVWRHGVMSRAARLCQYLQY